MGRPKKQELVPARKLEGYDAGNLERSSGDRWITMQNALVRAGQGLSLSEKRLMMLAVSKLDSRRSVKPGDLPATRITAEEYAEAFQVDSNTAYEQLQGGAKHLYNRSITFFQAAERRRGKALEPTKVQMRWVGSVKYQKGEGWVELDWFPKVIPYLTGIKKQFTTYQLKQASALRSVYSWRLLELLTRFEREGQGEALYSVEDFVTSMEAPPSLVDFGQIRRRIIEPAVKELAEKDGWLIDWTPIKAGRKVAKLRFRFKRDPQGRLF